MEEATTITGWTLAIYRALESYDIDPAPYLEQAEIELDTVMDHSARIPTRKNHRLMNLASEAVQDPAFGLVVGQNILPSSFYALGYANWASSTLYETFERFCRLLRVFTTCAYCELIDQGDQIGFRAQAYPEFEDILTPEQFEGFLACCIEISRKLMPGEFKLKSAQLLRPRPANNISAFEQFFDCPIEWDAEAYTLLMDRQMMEKALPSANPELAYQNEQLCMDYIARFDQQDIVNRVSRKLVEMLPNGEPSMEATASELALSTRTLQRKLKDHDSSYKQLLDNLRKDMAMQYLRQPHMPIAEISYQLGFAHISNFSRAFKRWTGQTPADYRDNPVDAAP